MLVFPALCLSELQPRIWATSGTNHLQGAFCKELLGGVQIRDANGEKHLILIDQLSVSDKSYISLYVAPRMSVRVSHAVRKWEKTEWSLPNDDIFFYTFTVRLQKESKLPYKGRLKAELFIIGNERLVPDDSRLVLMEYFKREFVFPEDRKSTCEFSTPEVAFPEYRPNWVYLSSAVNRGKTYRGWVLDVTDERGQLVFSDHDIDVRWITDDLERSIAALRELYLQNRGSKESRHFNRAFKKLEPPSIPWFRRNRTY